MTREDGLTLFAGEDKASLCNAHLFRAGNFWEKIKMTQYPLGIFRAFLRRSKYVEVDKWGGLDINKYKSIKLPLYDLFDEKYSGEYIRIFFLDPQLNQNQRLLENMPSIAGKDEEIENLKAQLLVKQNQIIDLMIAIEQLDEDIATKKVINYSKGLEEIKKKFGNYIPFNFQNKDE